MLDAGPKVNKNTTVIYGSYPISDGKAITIAKKGRIYHYMLYRESGIPCKRPFLANEKAFASSKSCKTLRIVYTSNYSYSAIITPIIVNLHTHASIKSKGSIVLQ